MKKFHSTLIISLLILFSLIIAFETITLRITNRDIRYQNFNKEQKIKSLNLLQYQVTQRNSTEEPYKNLYWQHKEPGIYVDVVSGEPLFSSTDKYDAGTGWPSFSKPINDRYIVLKKKVSSFLTHATEVRSKYGDSHLGYVFNDGPPPSGKRYSINSASLRFVPASQLEKEGYQDYNTLFKK